MWSDASSGLALTEAGLECVLKYNYRSLNNEKYQGGAPKEKRDKKPKSGRAGARSGLGWGAGAVYLLFEVALEEVRYVNVMLLGLRGVWIEVVLSVRDALINDQLDRTLGLEHLFLDTDGVA